MARSLSEPERDLKVKLPTRLVQQLHALKVIHGKPIRQVLVEALELYYQGPAGQAVVDANEILKAK